MTQRRILHFATLSVACVCLTPGVLAMLAPEPSVTEANLNRVQNGMSIRDAERILGKAGEPTPELTFVGSAATFCWPGVGGVAVVAVKDDLIVDTGWIPVQHRDTMLGKLRRWLQLPK
jgi:hypothetical protein